MNGFVQNYQDLEIQKEEIEKATNNFDDQNNYIGGGGFGKVYKGVVSHSKGRSKAAVKRLDRRHGQGEAEFMKEIDTLTRYKHENLISLLGLCYQGDEAFIVYELASRGSLDGYLNSPDLTWSKRIKICLDAAKGLRYLHDPRGTHQRVIHCDIKGGNILLDDHWNAKIADFGFSIIGPANELHSSVINLAAGTLGYIDPLYRTTNSLTKESDVYSFGVVLFEVLFGKLCYTQNNGHIEQILVPKWKEYYEENKLNDIVFKDPAIQPLEQSVLKIFSDIAYQCLNESRKDRPEMAVVVTELQTALSIHELLQNQEFISNWNGQGVYYKALTKSAEPPLNYGSEDELIKLLFKGVLLNEGKTWFSLNKKGDHCEMISIEECLDSKFESYRWSSKYNSRFPVGTYFSYDAKFKTHVKTQFLSLGITYTVILVFKFGNSEEARKCVGVSLKYKIHGETETSVSHLAYQREDGWWIVELYQFTCDQRFVHLQILFEGYNYYTFIAIEGIEFQPLEKVEHKEDENQPISDSDADWEEKLPTDYEDILKWSKNSLQWATKKEAYSFMREGFLVNDVGKEGSIWFCLDKNGKKSHMLSARKVVGQTRGVLPLLESRFGEAIQLDHWSVDIEYEVQSKLVSSQTTYAIYLVYKLSEDQSGFEAPMRVYNEEYSGSGDKDCLYICLVDPQTPLIKPKADQSTRNPASKSIKECLPQQRSDGWMEVQLWEFRSATTIMSPICLDLKTSYDHLVRKKKKFRGLIIEGVEFRPV